MALIIQDDVSEALRDVTVDSDEKSLKERILVALKQSVANSIREEIGGLLDVLVEEGPTVPTLVNTCNTLHTSLPWVFASGLSLPDSLMQRLSSIKPDYDRRDWCFRLGAIMCSLRLTKGIGQHDFAKELGIDAQALEDQERGAQCLPLNSLSRVVERLGVTLPWLFYVASQSMSYKDDDEMFRSIRELATSRTKE